MVVTDIKNTSKFEAFDCTESHSRPFKTMFPHSNFSGFFLWNETVWIALTCTCYGIITKVTKLPVDLF